MSLLEVRDLSVQLQTKTGFATAIDRLSFTVSEGEILGIAGESGSGKTMTALTLLGLLPQHAKVSGSVKFNGQELVGLSSKEWQKVRGAQIAMVFQDPMTSLHPMLSVKVQMTEHMVTHLGISQQQALIDAEELLADVRIPDPKKALNSYAGQFSGGMRQRICIAMALACKPKLLLADEPSTALDVTVQAGILTLLDRLRQEHQLSIIFITHDLGVLSSITNKLLVLYAGRETESGATSTVLQRPRHPYTQGLLDSLPQPDSTEKLLKSIAGFPPELGKQPIGCAFAERCKFAEPQCSGNELQPTLLGDEHKFICIVDPFSESALRGVNS
jgi:peptide/nickel transport system ATP-binding protein/oligopeptide transport system ATP-binding protein